MSKQRPNVKLSEHIQNCVRLLEEVGDLDIAVSDSSDWSGDAEFSSSPVLSIIEDSKNPPRFEKFIAIEAQGFNEQTT